MYSSKKQSDAAGKMAKGADPFRSERKYYQEMLRGLMANPSSVLQDPIFQGSLDLGYQGVSRQMASRGFMDSGNEMIGLFDYGQKSALGYLQQQEQFLAQLGGAQLSSTSGAAAALYGASANNMAEGFGQLGQAGAMIPGLGGTTAGGTGTSGTPIGGGFSNTPEWGDFAGGSTGGYTPYNPTGP
jgi:hypothetical protein